MSSFRADRQMRVAVILLLVFSMKAAEGNPAAILGGVLEGLNIAMKVAKLATNVNNMNSEDLLRRFAPIEDSIQTQGRDVRSIIELLKDMGSEEDQRQWDFTIETFESLLRDITSPYDDFLFYQKNASAIEQFTLLQFANNVVSNEPNSPHLAVYSLRDLVLGNARLRSSPETSSQQDIAFFIDRQRRYVFKQGLFRQLKSLVKASRLPVCGLGRSPQQVAYELYGIVIMALAKTYSMTQFAYMLLRLFEKGSFVAESEKSKEKYMRTSLAVTLEASTVMRELDPTFWRCDPPQHERGATYEEVTELLQGHIENEVDLSSSRSCTGSCSDFNGVNPRGRCYDATGHPHSSSAMLCERQRPCNGSLYHCRYVAESATVCLADPNQDTHRRYNWVQYSDGHVKGRKNDASLGDCDGKPKVWGWLRGFVRCSSCFCLCDDDTHSERYFSLVPVVSDISENKVVTGVRVVKMDGVFYIQLQQGQPDRLGYINASTIHWKSIDRRIDFGKDVEGEDYVRLSYEKRSVLLQELRGSPGQVVTGVSFHMAKSHLSLNIRVTAISDVFAGTPDQSVWLMVESPTDPPRLHLTSGPVPPTVSAARNWPDSHPGQVVKFEASSLHADAAQTTLPLLDVQEVAPRPAVWLAGVGLFHKGQGDSGGFIGLSVQMASMTLTEEQQMALVTVSRRPELINGTTSLDEILNFQLDEDGRE